MSGCAEVPIALAGAGAGINFTSTTAYRSFTHTDAEVRAATLQALERMQIAILVNKMKGDVVKIKAVTKHLAIYITLTPITPMLTKASIDAERTWVMKDQTVAAEILIQMARTMERVDLPGPCATAARLP
jgi:hypothetical protein